MKHDGTRSVMRHGESEGHMLVARGGAMLSRRLAAKAWDDDAAASTANGRSEEHSWWLRSRILKVGDDL